MAAAKIVGLVVTPTTLDSSTSDCRFPLRMRSRDRSSSHTATPAEESSASFSFCAMTVPFGLDFRTGRVVGSAVAGGVEQDSGGIRPDGCARRCRGRRDALARGGDDGLGGEAEFLEEHGVGGAGAVVVQADDPAGVADEVAPP